MRNYQGSSYPEIGKNIRYFDDIFDAILEKTTALNATCTTWNMIINSIDLFQGLQFKGSSVTGSSLGSSVIESSLGSWVLGMPH